MKKPKLGIFCMAGLTHFINMYIPYFEKEYDITLYSPTNTGELRQQLKEPDIIWLEWGNELAAVASQLVDKPTLLRIHSYEVFTHNLKVINFDKINTTIFVANHIKEMANITNSNTKQVVVHNGVKIPKFTPHKPGFNIGYVANINYKKNPVELVNIAYNLRNTQFKIHVAGAIQDPRYKYYFDYIIDKYKLPIIFHGYVEDMDYFYSEMNYLLSTSMHESFSYAIAEGMVHGIRPIIREFRGASDLYPEKYLYNTDNEIITALYNDDYNSKEYYEYIKTHYNIEDKAKELLSLIKEVI